MADQSDSPRRLLGTFLDLVRIDSPSGEEAACAAYCERVLTEAGCRVWFDNSAPLTGSDTGNLIAELPGNHPATLVLSAHLDVVQPCVGVEPIVADGVVFSAGETILGGDDKAGLAAAIECVRRLAEEPGQRPTVRCVFSVQEEIGLHGAKQLEPETVAGDLCLVLDAAGDPGGIVIAAPTHYTFTATFIGRAAHAGVEPEAGLSAIGMAADAVRRLPMGRLDAQTTANVGTIAGGTATNVVAARTVITGECRSLIRERVETVREEMDRSLRAAAEEHGGSVDISWTLEYEGFAIPEDSAVLDVVRAGCRDAGLRDHTFSTGGGSDANVIAAHGVPTVALSCGMTGVHGTDEQISVADLVSLSELCLAVARRLAD